MSGLKIQELFGTAFGLGDNFGQRWGFVGSAECALKAVAEAAHGFAIQGVADLRAAVALVEQVSFAQAAQVLRDGRLRERQRGNEIAAAGFAALLQDADDGNASRVRERSRKSS